MFSKETISSIINMSSHGLTGAFARVLPVAVIVRD